MSLCRILRHSPSPRKLENSKVQAPLPWACNSVPPLNTHASQGNMTFFPARTLLEFLSRLIHPAFSLAWTTALSVSVSCHSPCSPRHAQPSFTWLLDSFQAALTTKSKAPVKMAARPLMALPLPVSPYHLLSSAPSTTGAFLSLPKFVASWGNSLVGQGYSFPQSCTCLFPSYLGTKAVFPEMLPGLPVMVHRPLASTLLTSTPLFPFHCLSETEIGCLLLLTCSLI